MVARFKRLKEFERNKVDFFIDGRPASGLEGDTVLVAVMQHCSRIRRSEFGDGDRAGFCLMGACQDCWVSVAQQRVRACTTALQPGMQISTTPLELTWPKQ